MPKAWSEEEKQVVKASLMREGRKVFEKHGLLKATVDDIVAGAHVSKGTFYVFFQSKEELYLEIMNAAREELQEAMFKDAFHPGASRRACFRAFLVRMVESIARIPVFGLMDEAVYEQLRRKIPEEKLSADLGGYTRKSDLVLSDWMKRSLIKKADLAALNGIFLSYISHYVTDASEEKRKRAELSLWADALSAYFVQEEINE